MSVTGTTRRLPRGAVLPRVRLRDVAGVLLVAAVCCLPLVFYAPFFNEPFMRDEGFFAAVAQGMRDGSVPYVDAFDNKPPMVFYWYFLSFELFGETVWAPRLLVALLLCGATGAMYLTARLLMGHGKGLIAAAAFGSAFFLARFETNANTEFFMLPFMVLAMLCFVLATRSRNSWWYVASGAASGVAVMTKETALFILLFFMILSLVRGVREKGWGLPAARPALSQGLGALVAGLVITAPIAVQGGFPAMFDALVIYTLDYVGESTLPERVLVVAKTPLFLLLMAGPWAFFGAFGMFYGLQRKNAVDGVLLAGWFFAAWLGIVAAGRFYLHYYIMLAPALSLLVPLGVAYFRENLSRKLIQVTAVVCLPVAFVGTLYLHGIVYAQPDADARHLAKYAYDDWTLWEIESRNLADWIAARTDRDDEVYNLGFHSEIYFYADRDSPTRYLFDHPYRAGQKYIDDAIAELEANPPLYVVDSAKYEYRLDQWGYPLPDQARLRVEEDEQYYGQQVTEWVRDRYDYLGRVYYADVYRMREPESQR